MPKLFLQRVFPLSLSIFIFFAQAEGFTLQQRSQATQQEEMQMLGMIVGAVQDIHGGHLGEARGRFEKIMRELEKREYSPHLRWQAHNQYGMFLLKAGERDAALKALIRSRDEAKALTNKEILKSTFDLAFAYSLIGEINEAIKEYKAALILDPQNFDVMLELGSTYRRAKLFTEARELYEKLIVSHSKNANVYGNLGNVYLDQGDLEAAVANYEKAAALSSAHPSNKAAAAQNFLNAGFRYAERGNHEKALALYRRALEITPDNPVAYADIGWSMLSTGKTQEAIEAFEKALKLNPSKEVKEYAHQGLKEARAKK